MLSKEGLKSYDVELFCNFGESLYILGDCGLP